MIDDVMEYWGYSELFDKIDEGYLVPEYVVSVSITQEDGYRFYDVKAERI